MKLNSLCTILIFSYLTTIVISLRKVESLNLSPEDKEVRVKVVSRKKGFNPDTPIHIRVYCESTKLFDGKFLPSTAKTPGTTYDRGIYFQDLKDFKKDDPKFTEIMVPDGDKYFISYRVLATEITFTDPWFAAKYLRGVYKRTNKETYIIYIYFDYSFWGGEIPNKNANLIRQYLNYDRNMKQSEITDIKDNVNENATQYIMNLKLYQDTKDKKKDLSSRIPPLEKDLIKSEATLKTSKEELTNAQDECAKIEKQLAEKTTRANILKTKISQIGRSADVMKKVLKTLKDNKNALGDPKELREDYEKERAEYRVEEKRLIREAPQAEKQIVEAGDALFKENSIGKNQDLLRTVWP